MNPKLIEELDKTFRNADILGLEEASVNFDSLTEEEKDEWIEVSKISAPISKYRIFGQKRHDGTVMVCEWDENMRGHTKNCKFVPAHLLGLA